MHDGERGVPRGREGILEAYDRLFSGFLEKPICLLELGSEGASSLREWAHRFPNAARIVGCVADSRAAAWRPDDARISLVEGDASAEGVRCHLLSCESSYDVIVETGRHRARNVVATFAAYFPHLRAGGLYLAEDLRCSRWVAHGGGLFNPFSSAAFFRRLADTLSLANCGLASPRRKAVALLATYYGATFAEESLAQIHSVEFLSTTCAVRKRQAGGGCIPEAAPPGVQAGEPGFGADRTGESTWPEHDGVPPSLDDEASDSRLRGEAIARLAAYHSMLTWPIARALMRLEGSWPKLARAAFAAPRVAWWGVTRQLPERLRLRRQAQEVLSAGLFDAAWYVRRYPIVALRGQDPLREWLQEGWRLGRDPHPRFNNTEYLRDHPDVIASGLNPIAHYLRIGRPQGRLVRLVGDEYPEWIRRFDSLSDPARAAMRCNLATLEHAPRVSVLMSTHNAQESWLRDAIESILRQIYPWWELCVTDDASTEPWVRRMLDDYASREPRIRTSIRTVRGGICAASNDALKLASGDYVALLGPQDTLAEHALYLVARELSAWPEADIVFTDEDRIDATGARHSPHFKPDFNAELFYSTGYLCRLGVFRRALVESVGGFRAAVEGAHDFDLSLRCVAETTPARIRHVPRVLYHRRDEPAAPKADPTDSEREGSAGVRALSDYFFSRQERVEVSYGGGGVYRMRFAIPEPPPLVSIIVPTRNKADLLRTCLGSVLSMTTYAAYEVLVVDNGSDEPAALSFLDELRREPCCRVLRFDAPFNYSAINNLAVSDARGDFVLLLNNDTEVITPGWLDELVMLAARDDVGSVGCMLRYADGAVQHAGVLLGARGIASHFHKYAPMGSSGYFGRLGSIQEVSANTAACLLVRKEHYFAVGGLDEENLPVSFNDVDFCLRLRSAGLRNLWTPYAQLYHHESKSRGLELSPDAYARALGEGEYLRWRWGAWLLSDPAYNPNLTLEREDFSLAWPPRLLPLGKEQ